MTQASLVKLKNDEKFSTVKMWGKVSGVYNDYYIAQGYGENHVEERKTFFRCDELFTTTG